MQYSILKFKRNEKHVMRDLEKLRGFLIDRYPEYTLFHNHLNDKFDYSYPRLQYKLIKNTLALMTIGEMLHINEKLFQEIEYLNINDNLFFDFDKELEIFEAKIEYSFEKMYEYKFVTPYLPLNEKNFKKYLKGEYTLEQAVINNVLEVLKGLGIRLEKGQRVFVETDFEKSSIRTLKDIKMLSFGGKFLTNIKFPDYFSIGKRKSLGYGTFIRIKDGY